jgi:hypothetical protein
MNSEQFKGFLQTLMGMAGASSFVATYFTSEMWSLITGVVLSLGALIWVYITQRVAAQIARVAELPDVKHVVVLDPKLADAIPSAKVVARA